MMQILLLRIGIDMGCGGTLGPVFKDKSFEYVPIPESRVGPKSIYYKSISANNGGMLDQFVPKKYKDGPAHYDPEFQTFTYGDPTTNKRRQLLRMNEGDIILFYAGLKSEIANIPPNLYIIGYFIVKNIHDIGSQTKWPPPKLARLHKNAHFRRPKYEKDLVVVEGNKRKSRLLTKAELISCNNQNISPRISTIIGLKGSIKRAIGRWVPDSHIRSTTRWIFSLK